ncbi:MAG: CopG family antitoxin [Candidatus Binataceae bacterium]
MKKKLLVLKTDKEAEDFVANADLTEYDLSGMQTVRFEFQPKTERVNMRLPGPLLDAVKATARKAGVPYQRFIRQAIEAAILRTKSSRSVKSVHDSGK